MVVNLFSLKNHPSQSYSTVCTLFATTRLLLYWRVLAIHAMVGWPLSYSSRNRAICQWTRTRVVVNSAGCGILGKVPWHIALWRLRYANGRPNHCANCHSWESRIRVVAKSAESEELVFTSMDVVLYGLSLLDGRFLNRKKGPQPLVWHKLLLHGLISITISWHYPFKGTVSRDFWPSVFSIKTSILGPWLRG
jgi:hypothetical protein